MVQNDQAVQIVQIVSEVSHDWNDLIDRNVLNGLIVLNDLNL